MLRIEEGRPPETQGEVALSRRLLESLRREVGDSVEVDGHSSLITGVAVLPEDLRRPVAIKAAGYPSPGSTLSLLVGADPLEMQATRQRWSKQEVTFRLRSETGRASSFEALVILVCGGFGFFEASLVIGAAIAVGMRRRQRELGLLSSNGAEQPAMVKALLFSTAMLAAAGSLIGVGLGWVVARGMYPKLLSLIHI